MSGIVNRILTQTFRKVGESVALYPKYFITASIIVTLTLGTGILRINYDNDVNRLYSNLKGRNVYEKEQIDKYFGANYSGAFSTSRITDAGRLARIIVTATDNGTLFRNQIFKELTKLNNIIHSVQITHLGVTYSYNELCARPSMDNCFENEILELGLVMGLIENGSLSLSYPITINPETFTAHALPQNLGGSTVSSDESTLISAQALNLNYFLKFESQEDDEKGRLWEDAVTAAVISAHTKLTHIRVLHFTSNGILTEQHKNTFTALPYLAITIIPMCCFVVFTTMSRDSVRGKPWVAIYGILAANLGSLAAFGTMIYVGVPFTAMNLSILFIMLGKPIQID